jgi:uncharacterized membrane protein
MDTTTLLILFACFGIGDTAYLIYANAAKGDVVCLFFPQRWCRKVQHSSYSRTLGVPNAVAGFLMYAGILVFTLLQPSVPFWPVAVLVGIGAAFSVYFLAVQIFVLRALCTWCVVSFINFAVMFWAVFLR